MKINTLLGEMEEELLEKTEAVYEDDNERTTWIEYRKKGDPPPDVLGGLCMDCKRQQAGSGRCFHIHRSAQITLKKGLSMQSEAGTFAAPVEPGTEVNQECPACTNTFTVKFTGIDSTFSCPRCGALLKFQLKG